MYLVNNISQATEYGNVEFWYEGDPTVTTDDRIIFRMAFQGGGTTTNVAQFLSVGFASPSTDHPSIPPDSNYKPTFPIAQSVQIPTGSPVSFALYWDWQNLMIDVWASYYPTNKMKLLFQNVPFRYQVSAFERMDLYNNQPHGPKYFFANFRLCNAAGGSKYQPLSKGSRVAQSTSNMREKIAGQIDFGYQTSEVNSQVQSSSNYKLKGGDSSKVDLLNTRNAVTTFTDWKATIPQNPAPTAFSLRAISFLFQKDEVQMQDAASEAPYMVSPRAQMDAAITDFLTTKEVGEISYTKAADQPASFEASNVAPPILS